MNFLNRSNFVVAAFVLIFNATSLLYGQMIQTQVPFTSVGTSFHERIGIDFGFNFRGTPVNTIGDQTRGVFGLGPNGQILPNITFSQGSVNSAVPPFGGFDPASEGNFGFRVQNDKGGFNLGFRFSQGRTSTLTNTTPVLMTTNGATGSIFDGTATPFVTGVIPVVGNGGFAVGGESSYVHPLEMKLRQMHMDQLRGPATTSQTTQNSSESSNEPVRAYGNPESTATQGDLSVKEIKRRRELALQQEENEQAEKARGFAQKAKEAFDDGNKGAARSYMRKAVRYATGNQKQVYQKQLEQLILLD